MTEQEQLFVDEISEEMAQFIAESLNGGEFDSGKWYTDGQRSAWIKAVRPWAEEIVELRGKIGEMRLERMMDKLAGKND